MDLLKKQILFASIIVVLSIIFLAIGFPAKIENYTSDMVTPLAVRYGGSRTNEVALSVAIGVQVLMATAILATPVSLIGGSWFLKMGFDLMLGAYKETNVFIISQSLNIIVGILCWVMAGYAIYNQFIWIKKLTSPLPFRSDDKDLTKFI